ncbi:fimbrial protein [Salmonella enterica subsp. enterica]|nr:long polar fimbrial protein LpfA [Salmonella enterica subsp. enterica serovar Infantis]EBY6676433.1 long polar fimbrial protein LpfA [Salmonella enterica subsp. enterica serovar Saphra]EDV1283684.1 fimbrial protein [Salmonella enterica subsp. enterica]EEI1308622.1 fimbrial protein [Salmonella enterica]ECB1141645.1 long polar fimbrial protein LpfA [Salmonella enterica subsp. enterica serovar Saphra]
MRNKIILAMAAAGMMCATSAFAAADGDSGGGTINFTGSVINAPCSVSTDSQNINVLLGQVSNSSLNTVQHSDPKKITISLINCSFPAHAPTPADNSNGEVKVSSDSTYSKVAVEFDGFSKENQAALALGEIPNTAANGAQNVAIQLLKSDTTTPVDLTQSNQENNAIPLDTTLTNQDLIFYARMAALGGGTVTTGAVGATVTYKLKYF